MNKQPKVSVIIPVYNVKDFLQECIDSVINQTLKDIEIICVDDESTDGSYDILLDYEKKDTRVKVIRQKNGGAGAARNHGLKYASGEYLSFLDADDFFEKDMLEKAYNKIIEDDSEIVVFRCGHYIDADKEFLPNKYSIRSKLLPKHSPFAGVDIEKDAFKVFVGWAWDKLFKTSYIRELNLQFQEQRTTNDMLFVFSAIVKANKIVTMDDVLVYHRRAASSLTATRSQSWHCFYNALLALRNQLNEWNLYDRFQQDFINYCVHLCMWNLNTLAEPTHTLLYNKLRQEWFEELGITKYEREYFYNKYEYERYRLVCEYPIESFPFEEQKKVEVKDDTSLVSKATTSLKEEGFIYTIKKVISKIFKN